MMRKGSGPGAKCNPAGPPPMPAMGVLTGVKPNKSDAGSAAGDAVAIGTPVPVCTLGSVGTTCVGTSANGGSDCPPDPALEISVWTTSVANVSSGESWTEDDSTNGTTEPLELPKADIAVDVA